MLTEVPPDTSRDRKTLSLAASVFPLTEISRIGGAEGIKVAVADPCNQNGGDNGSEGKTDPVA